MASEPDRRSARRCALWSAASPSSRRRPTCGASATHRSHGASSRSRACRYEIAHRSAASNGLGHQRRRRRRPDRCRRALGAVPRSLRASRVRADTRRARHAPSGTARICCRSIPKPDKQLGRLKPDILIRDGIGNLTSVVDAKYKRLRSWQGSPSGVDRGDLCRWPPTSQATTSRSERWPTRLTTAIGQPRTSTARGLRAKVSKCASFVFRLLPPTRHADSKRC